MKSILFVCMGNICRSPAGEAALRQLAKRKNLSDQLNIESAGTHAYHVGEFPDPRMRAAGERRGYSFQTRARKIQAQDLSRFDLIVAMDRDNLQRIELLPGVETSKARICLMSEFIDRDHLNWNVDVPDPYYGGDEGFEVVLDMIETAAPNILLALQETGQSHA